MFTYIIIYQFSFETGEKECRDIKKMHHYILRLRFLFSCAIFNCLYSFVSPMFFVNPAAKHLLTQFRVTHWRTHDFTRRRSAFRVPKST